MKDLEAFLTEERLQDGWESKIRKPHGLTLLTFSRTVLAVENGIDESKFAPATRPETATETSPNAHEAS